ncbi:expressed unknown protein [Seminavis robusta]|uniref:DEP domain-containing protein n=1 Tax=Seminavis robusta TaxID=568900 RepID=A0A9N8ECK0_9STRA|nr:expressed unknown protein [Seminavis robusta]|eukprot:Sro948_g223600.1 n/a (333) ;mRNA; f:36245-37243
MPLDKSNSNCSMATDRSMDRSMDSSCGSHDMEGFKFEAVADLMQEQLRAENSVRDHKYGMKKIPNSFLGCDAVTALKDILETERLQSSDPSSFGNKPVTREEALEYGRKIAKDYRFFVHVNACKNKQLVLEDTDKDVYVFQNNLPIQVYKMKKQYPTPWSRVKVLEEHVQVKDNRGIVRVFQNSFIASEAVDVLMELKLVRSRGEGTHIMQKMNDKVKFFKSANSTDQSDFRDDKAMFLQFTPKEDRVQEPKPQNGKKRSSRSLSPKGKKSDRSLSPSRGKGSDRSLKGDESNRSRSMSPTKDRAYFESRAKDVRSGLGKFHEQRIASNCVA